MCVGVIVDVWVSVGVRVGVGVTVGVSVGVGVIVTTVIALDDITACTIAVDVISALSDLRRARHTQAPQVGVVKVSPRREKLWMLYSHVSPPSNVRSSVQGPYTVPVIVKNHRSPAVFVVCVT